MGTSTGSLGQQEEPVAEVKPATKPNVPKMPKVEKLVEVQAGSDAEGMKAQADILARL